MKGYLKKFREAWVYYDYHPVLLFLGLKMFFFSIQHAHFNNFFVGGSGWEPAWPPENIKWFIIENFKVFINVLLPLFMFNKSILKPLLILKIAFRTHELIGTYFLADLYWDTSMVFNCLGWSFDLLIWVWVYFRIKREELYKELKV